MYIQRSLLIGGANITNISSPMIGGSVQAVLTNGEYLFSADIVNTVLELELGKDDGTYVAVSITFTGNTSTHVLSQIKASYVNNQQAPPVQSLYAHLEDGVVRIELADATFSTLRCLGGTAIEYLGFPEFPNPLATQRRGDVLYSAHSTLLPNLGEGAYLVKYEDRTSSSINRGIDAVARNAEELERRSRNYDVVERVVPCSTSFNSPSNDLVVSLRSEGIWLAEEQNYKANLPPADYINLLNNKRYKRIDLLIKSLLDWYFAESAISVSNRTNPSIVNGLVDDLGGHVLVSNVYNRQTEFDEDIPFNSIYISSSNTDVAVGTGRLVSDTNKVDVRGSGTLFGPRLSGRISATAISHSQLRLSVTIPSLVSTIKGGETFSELLVLTQFGVFQLDRIESDTDLSVKPWSGDQANFFLNNYFEMPSPQTLPSGNQTDVVFFVGRCLPSSLYLYATAERRDANGYLKTQTYTRATCRFAKHIDDLDFHHISDFRRDVTGFKLLTTLDPHSDNLAGSCFTNLSKLTAFGTHRSSDTLPIPYVQTEQSLSYERLGTNVTAHGVLNSVSVNGGYLTDHAPSLGISKILKINLYSARATNVVGYKALFPIVIEALRGLPSTEQVSISEALVRFIYAKDVSLPTSYSTLLTTVFSHLLDQTTNPANALHPSDMTTVELEKKLELYREIIKLHPFSLLRVGSCSVTVSEISSDIVVTLTDSVAYFDPRDVGRIFTFKKAKGRIVSAKLKEMLSNNKARFSVDPYLFKGAEQLDTVTIGYCFDTNPGSSAHIIFESAGNIANYSNKSLESLPQSTVDENQVGYSRLTKLNREGLDSLELTPLADPPIYLRTEAVLEPNVENRLTCAATALVSLDVMSSFAVHTHRETTIGDARFNQDDFSINSEKNYTKPWQSVLSYKSYPQQIISATSDNKLLINKALLALTTTNAVDLILNSHFGAEAWVEYVLNEAETSGSNYQKIVDGLLGIYQNAGSDIYQFFPYSTLEMGYSLGTVTTREEAVRTYLSALYAIHNVTDVYDLEDELIISHVRVDSVNYSLAQYLIPDLSITVVKQTALLNFIKALPALPTLSEGSIILRYTVGSEVKKYPRYEDYNRLVVPVLSDMNEVITNSGTSTIVTNSTYVATPFVELDQMAVFHKVPAGNVYTLNKTDFSGADITSSTSATDVKYTQLGTEGLIAHLTHLLATVESDSVDDLIGGVRPLYIDRATLETAYGTTFPYNQITSISQLTKLSSSLNDSLFRFVVGSTTFYLQPNTAVAPYADTYLQNYTGTLTGYSVAQESVHYSIYGRAVAENVNNSLSISHLSSAEGVSLVLYPLYPSRALQTVPRLKISSALAFEAPNEQLRTTISTYNDHRLLARARLHSWKKEDNLFSATSTFGSADRRITHSVDNVVDPRKSTSHRNGAYFTITSKQTSTHSDQLKVKSALRVSQNETSTYVTGLSRDDKRQLSGVKYNPQAKTDTAVDYISIIDNAFNGYSTKAMEVFSKGVGIHLGLSNRKTGIDSRNTFGENVRYEPMGLLSVSGNTRLNALSYLTTNNDASMVYDHPYLPESVNHVSSLTSAPTTPVALHVSGMSKLQGALRVTGDAPDTIFDIRNLGSSLDMPNGIYGHLNPTQTARRSKYLESSQHKPYQRLRQHHMSVETGPTFTADTTLLDGIESRIIENSELPPPLNTPSAQGKSINKKHQQDIPQLGERGVLFNFFYEFGVTSSSALLTNNDYLPTPRYWVGRGHVDPTASGASPSDFADEGSRYNGVACVYLPPTFDASGKIMERSDAFRFGFSRPVFSFGQDYVGRSVVFRLGFNKEGDNLSDYKSPWFVGVISAIKDNGASYRVGIDEIGQSTDGTGITEVFVLPTKPRFDSGFTLITETVNSFYLLDPNLRNLTDSTPFGPYVGTVKVGDATTPITDYTYTIGTNTPSGTLYISGAVHGREWTLNAFQTRISDRLFIESDLGDTATTIYSDRQGDTHIHGRGGTLNISGYDDVVIENQNECISATVTVALRRFMRKPTPDEFTNYLTYFSNHHSVSTYDSSTVPIIPDVGLYSKMQVDWSVDGQLDVSRDSLDASKGLSPIKHKAPEGYDLDFNYINQYFGASRRPLQYIAGGVTSSAAGLAVVRVDTKIFVEWNLVTNVTTPDNMVPSGWELRDSLIPPNLGFFFHFAQAKTAGPVTVNPGYYPLHSAVYAQSANHFIGLNVVRYEVDVPLYISVGSPNSYSLDVDAVMTTYGDQIRAFFFNTSPTQLNHLIDFHCSYEFYSEDRREIIFNASSPNLHNILLAAFEGLSSGSNILTAVTANNAIEQLYTQDSVRSQYATHTVMAKQYFFEYERREADSSLVNETEIDRVYFSIRSVLVDYLLRRFNTRIGESFNLLVEALPAPIKRLLTPPIDQVTGQQEILSHTNIVESLTRENISPNEFHRDMIELWRRYYGQEPIPMANFLVTYNDTPYTGTGTSAGHEDSPEYRLWVDEQSGAEQRQGIELYRAIANESDAIARLSYEGRVAYIAEVLSPIYRIPAPQLEDHFRRSEFPTTTFDLVLNPNNTRSSLASAYPDRYRFILTNIGKNETWYTVDRSPFYKAFSAFPGASGTVLGNAVGKLTEDYWTNWFGTGTLFDDHASDQSVSEFDYRDGATGTDLYPTVNVLQALRYPIIRIPSDKEVVSLNVVEIDPSAGGASYRSGTYLANDGTVNVGGVTASHSLLRTGSLSSQPSASALLGWSSLDTLQVYTNPFGSSLHSNSLTGYSNARSLYNRRNYEYYSVTVTSEPRDETVSDASLSSGGLKEINDVMYTHIGPVASTDVPSSNPERMSGGLLGVLGRTRGYVNTAKFVNCVPLELNFNYSTIHDYLQDVQLDPSTSTTTFSTMRHFNRTYANEKTLRSNPSLYYLETPQSGSGTIAKYVALAEGMIRFRIDMEVRPTRRRTSSLFSSAELYTENSAFIFQTEASQVS